MRLLNTTLGVWQVCKWLKGKNEGSCPVLLGVQVEVKTGNWQAGAGRRRRERVREF
jgi:hypothetical protein